METHLCSSNFGSGLLRFSILLLASYGISTSFAEPDLHCRGRSGRTVAEDAYRLMHCRDRIGRWHRRQCGANWRDAFADFRRACGDGAIPIGEIIFRPRRSKTVRGKLNGGL